LSAKALATAEVLAKEEALFVLALFMPPQFNHTPREK
jgi:hypothetical protein